MYSYGSYYIAAFSSFLGYHSADAQPLLKEDVVIYDSENLRVIVPENPLLKGSIQITPKRKVEHITDWNQEESNEARLVIQRVADIWKSKGITNFLVYGKDSPSDKFAYEVVPYPSSWWKWKMWNQLTVLWRITFGAPTISTAEKKTVAKDFENKFSDLRAIANKVKEVAKGTDVFDNPKIIDYQYVLKGKHVNVLYDIKQENINGHKLHFLVVPNEHMETFNDLTEEVHNETEELTRKVIRHFNAKGVTTAYVYDKTGSGAGQTIPHFHKHILLFTASKTQEFWGKCKYFINMFWPSKLPQNEFVQRRDVLREELKDRQAP